MTLYFGALLGIKICLDKEHHRLFFVPIVCLFCCVVRSLRLCLGSVTLICHWDGYELFPKQAEFMSFICFFPSPFCHHSCVVWNFCWCSWWRHFYCMKSQALENGFSNNNYHYFTLHRNDLVFQNNVKRIGLCSEVGQCYNLGNFCELS